MEDDLRREAGPLLGDLAAVEWQMPWRAITRDERGALEQELRLELQSGHVLHGRRACAIARRVDGDDVLFLVSAPKQLAVVHLTFSSRAEAPPWPVAEVFEQVRQLVEMIELIGQDAAGYAAG